MTGQMLTYRAASAWARIYCPEVSLGLVTPEEALDVEAVAVHVVNSPAPAVEEEPLRVGAVEFTEPDPEPEPEAAPAPEPEPTATDDPEDLPTAWS
jgi:hypothetical protein